MNIPLDKEKILATLEKYNIDRNQHVIISGAALVLWGVKDNTQDIDIAVSSKLYEEILNKYNCIFEKEVENYPVWFLDNVMNFSNHYYDEIEYTDCFGYKVQSLESILDLKIKLNRPKDKYDIARIKNMINMNGGKLYDISKNI